MNYKAASYKKPLFVIWPGPQLCQIWNGPINEIRLTLLCETMTFFTKGANVFDDIEIEDPALITKTCCYTM